MPLIHLEHHPHGTRHFWQPRTGKLGGKRGLRAGGSCSGAEQEPHFPSGGTEEPHFPSGGAPSPLAFINLLTIPLLPQPPDDSGFGRSLQRNPKRLSPAACRRLGGRIAAAPRCRSGRGALPELPGRAGGPRAHVAAPGRPPAGRRRRAAPGRGQRSGTACECGAGGNAGGTGR